jgi:hypothetical protein
VGRLAPTITARESHTLQGNLVSWRLYVMYFPSAPKKKKKTSMGLLEEMGAEAGVGELMCSVCL